MRTTLGIWLALLGTQLGACAAPPPPVAPPLNGSREGAQAEAPAKPPVAAADPVPAPDPATPEPTAGGAPAPEAPPEPEAEEKPSRSPVEILTGPDTAFQINYSGSAPAEAARKACEQKFSADDEAIAQCKADARAAFKADVIRFRKDGSHWLCVIYKRENSRLDEVYSARAALKEAAPNRVQLQFTSPEKGLRPLLKSKRDSLLSVPNDYSFVIDDPEWGRLVYEAKVGLVGS